MPKKKDPTAWRNLAHAIEAYKRLRFEAQAAANNDGFDRGIEANDLFQHWNMFRLPRRENRCGHELRCEVVSCEILDRCQPGHGPKG